MKKKYTLQERIDLLVKAKSTIKRFERDPYICNQISYAHSDTYDRHLSSPDVMILFPELVKHCPINMNLCNAWFPEGETKKRITILNKVIKELKAKL